MKTIEEVAFNRYISDQRLPKHKRIPAENYIDWANLGAREAQRWISIEEELPKKMSECGEERPYTDAVLVKTKDDIFYVGYYHYSSKSWMVENYGEIITSKVTHWRPIERY